MVLRILFILAVSCSVVKAQVALAADSVSGLPGTQLEVPIRALQWVDVVSCQGTIEWDTAVVQLDTVSQFGLPGLNANNFGYSLTPNGKLTFSWNEANLQGIQLTDSTAIFNLRFDLTGPAGSLSPIRFSSDPTAIEFTDSNFDLLNDTTFGGEIEIEDTTTVNREEAQKHLFEVSPNPVSSKTVIVWEGDGERLDWCLINLEGRVVDAGRLESQVGMNQRRWGELNEMTLPQGIYWLRWKSGEKTRLKKVLIDNTK